MCIRDRFDGAHDCHRIRAAGDTSRPPGAARLHLLAARHLVMNGGTELPLLQCEEAYTLPIRVLQFGPVSYTHLRAHETVLDLVCRLLLEKKKQTTHTTTVTIQIN